jgi:hypothetical protein
MVSKHLLESGTYSLAIDGNFINADDSIALLDRTLIAKVINT